jgi:hypothetical protein
LDVDIPLALSKAAPFRSRCRRDSLAGMIGA